MHKKEETEDRYILPTGAPLYKVVVPTTAKGPCITNLGKQKQAFREGDTDDFFGLYA